MSLFAERSSLKFKTYSNSSTMRFNSDKGLNRADVVRPVCLPPNRENSISDQSDGSTMTINTRGAFLRRKLLHFDMVTSNVTQQTSPPEMKISAPLGRSPQEYTRPLHDQTGATRRRSPQQNYPRQIQASKQIPLPRSPPSKSPPSKSPPSKSPPSKSAPRRDHHSGSSSLQSNEFEVRDRRRQGGILNPENVSRTFQAFQKDQFKEKKARPPPIKVPKLKPKSNFSDSEDEPSSSDSQSSQIQYARPRRGDSYYVDASLRKRFVFIPMARKGRRAHVTASY